MFKCFKTKTVEEKIASKREKVRAALLDSKLRLLDQETVVRWRKAELDLLDKMLADRYLVDPPPVVQQEEA
jgi:hypothetical protein